MQITRAADYAVRVMAQLASLPPGSRLQKRALVELSEAPESFLSKVLTTDGGAGADHLVARRRGRI